MTDAPKPPSPPPSEPPQGGRTVNPPFIIRLLLRAEDFIWWLFPKCTEAKLARVIEERLNPRKDGEAG